MDPLVPILMEWALVPLSSVTKTASQDPCPYLWAVCPVLHWGKRGGWPLRFYPPYQLGRVYLQVYIYPPYQS